MEHYKIVQTITVQQYHNYPIFIFCLFPSCTYYTVFYEPILCKICGRYIENLGILKSAICLVYLEVLIAVYFCLLILHYFFHSQSSVHQYLFFFYCEVPTYIEKGLWNLLFFVSTLLSDRSINGQRIGVEKLIKKGKKYLTQLLVPATLSCALKNNQNIILTFLNHGTLKLEL